MHKPVPEEEVTSLHDLSAVDLIAGYRAKQFSPSEVMEEVLDHVAAWEPHIKALYLFDPDGARAAARVSTDRWQKGEPVGTLDGVPVTIKDNIATKGQPIPLGAASVKLVPPRRMRRPPHACAKPARSSFPRPRCLITACCRRAFPASIPSPAIPGTSQEPGRVVFRRRRSGRGRLRTAASRDRYWRFGAAAGFVVRAGRAEAEFRARSGRSALCRPRGRADDPHRRRCGADDVRAVEAGPPRRHEPAGRQTSTGRRTRNRRASCASA